MEAACARKEEEDVDGSGEAMRQYEIWWVSLAPPVGRRPVLLLSRDSVYGLLARYVVAEVTTRIRGIPQEVALGRREGLPGACVANLDNIRTVEAARFKQRAGRLEARRVREVKRAVGHALGWPELVLDE